MGLGLLRWVMLGKGSPTGLTTGKGSPIRPNLPTSTRQAGASHAAYMPEKQDTLAPLPAVRAPGFGNHIVSVTPDATSGSRCTEELTPTSRAGRALPHLQHIYALESTNDPDMPDLDVVVEAAAERLQGATRGYLVRQRLRNQLCAHRAAERLQGVTRGYIVRRRSRIVREMRRSVRHTPFGVLTRRRVKTVEANDDSLVNGLIDRIDKWSADGRVRTPFSFNELNVEAGAAKRAPEQHFPWLVSSPRSFSTRQRERLRC